MDAPLRTLMEIVFEVHGDLCMLSHREMLTMWSRILARSGLPISYSKGFNPHPRLSLPFPRPVGAESDEEVLCVPLEGVVQLSDSGGFVRMVPEGCRIKSIEMPAAHRRRTAVRAEYLFRRGSQTPADFWLERLDRSCQQFQSGCPIVRQRQDPGKRPKSVDFREFLAELSGDCEHIRLACRVTPQGTLRPEEMLEWLELKRAELSGPPRRTCVIWQCN